MKARLATISLILSLTGCAHLTDQVRDSMNLATTLTEACTQPDIRNISSPESIADNLQTRALADFGFADRPVDVPDAYKTSYSVQSALTSIHDLMAAVDAQEKPGFADAIAAADKMRADAIGIKAVLQGEFARWRANIKATCGAGGSTAIACTVDFSAYIQTATAQVHDDYVTLGGDAQDFTRKLDADLAKAKSIDAALKNSLTQDSTRLTRYIAVMLVLLDDVAQNQRIADCAPCKTVFADVEDSGKQYLAYEAANITMNQLDHIARTAESKLDEIDQKSWFILSLGDFMYSKDIADKVSATIIDALPKKPVQLGNGDTASMLAAQSYIDGAYLQNAVTAYSCKRIAADMNNSDANAVRTETLLYPVYAGLICGFDEKNQQGKATSVCANATTPQPPKLAAVPAPAAKPTSLTGLFISVDSSITRSNQAAGKAANTAPSRAAIGQAMQQSL